MEKTDEDLPKTGKNGPKHPSYAPVKGKSSHSQPGGITQPDVTAANIEAQNQHRPGTAQHKQRI